MPMPANLVLRSFVDPADDEACQILEQRANQFGGGNRGGLRARLAKALIEGFPGHPKGFAAKARLCDEHEIVVVAEASWIYLKFSWIYLKQTQNDNLTRATASGTHKVVCPDR